MIMNATVTQVNRGYLLVIDSATGQEVRVNTPNANNYSVGDNIRITYNGIMTRSIPPQISAISIQRTGQGSTPAAIRAVILSRGLGFLMVRELSNNRQLRVNYRDARHFCVGQRVDIRYDTISLTNPPQITATDIIPVC